MYNETYPLLLYYIERLHFKKKTKTKLGTRKKGSGVKSTGCFFSKDWSFYPVFIPGSFQALVAPTPRYLTSSCLLGNTQCTYQYTPTYRHTHKN